MGYAHRCPACGQLVLPDGDVVTTGQAASILGCSASSLRTWLNDGRIPHSTTPGGHRRILRQDLEAYLDGKRWVKA